MRLTAQQKAERAQYIGASEIAILANVSPYRTKEHDLWLEKTGQAPYETEEDDAQNLGHLLEPIALQVLSKRIGLEVRPNSESRRHNLFAFRAATPDGIVFDRGVPVAVAECKAPGQHFWHHWGEDGDPNGIPPYVQLQANDQCAIWHMTRCHVSALLGNEVRTYVHEYSEATAVETFATCADWWESYVVPRIAPPVDGSESADRMLKALYPRSRPASLAASHEAELLARAYVQAKAAAKSHEEQMAVAEQGLKALLRENEAMAGDGWKVSWKSNTNGAPSWKSIAEELASALRNYEDEDFLSPLVAKYTGAPSRPFSLKKAGGK